MPVTASPLSLSFTGERDRACDVIPSFHPLYAPPLRVPKPLPGIKLRGGGHFPAATSPSQGEVVVPIFCSVSMGGSFIQVMSKMTLNTNAGERGDMEDRGRRKRI